MLFDLATTTTTDDHTPALLVVAVLSLWLVYLTLGLLRAAFRLLAGAKLLIAAAVLVGVPLTATAVAFLRLLG